MSKVFDLIKKEEQRQKMTIPLIPSENIASEAVRQALGSVLTNKYAEGYPEKRYYQGNEVVDQLESYALELGKKLFEVPHINVQPYSGSPANSAVLMALVEPGETICGIKLSAGGHLTHGHPKITFSGKYYTSVQYDVEADGRIDYEKLAAFVMETRPKLIWAGTTAYPYILDWKQFSKVAESVGAWLVADISHIAGLVTAGVHPSPVPWVDVVTATTHKTLRGPRGAIIGVTEKGQLRDPELAKKIDRAVFPGLQGGPHMNTIAAMAVAFEEALTPEFKNYALQIVKNAKALAERLISFGYKVYGTENHLMVVDVGVGRGAEVALALENAGIVCNRNTIPHDESTPFKPSGIRLGTPAVTTLGAKEKDMEMIASWVDRVIKNISNETEIAQVKTEVEAWRGSR